MLRFLSRRAFKALPTPTTRLIHNTGSAYTAPPDYNTFIYPGNSDDGPQLLRPRKRGQEVTSKDPRGSVDNQATGGDVNDYDAFFPDIDHTTLETSVADILGIPYLSKTTEAEAKKRVRIAYGYIHGEYSRTVFPFCVSYEGENRWVFFILDSGCPRTYLSDQTRKSLGIRPDMPRSMVMIGGHPSPAYMAPTDSQIRNINLLGTDFCGDLNAIKVENHRKTRARLYLDRNVGGAQKFKLE